MPDLYLRRTLLITSLAALATRGGVFQPHGASNRIVNVVMPDCMDVVQGNFVAKEQIEVVKPHDARSGARNTRHALAYQRLPCRSSGRRIYLQAPGHAAGSSAS